MFKGWNLPPAELEALVKNLDADVVCKFLSDTGKVDCRRLLTPYIVSICAGSVMFGFIMEEAVVYSVLYVNRRCKRPWLLFLVWTSTTLQAVSAVADVYRLEELFAQGFGSYASLLRPRRAELVASLANASTQVITQSFFLYRAWTFSALKLRQRRKLLALRASLVVVAACIALSCVAAILGAEQIQTIQTYMLLALRTPSTRVYDLAVPLWLAPSTFVDIFLASVIFWALHVPKSDRSTKFAALHQRILIYIRIVIQSGVALALVQLAMLCSWQYTLSLSDPFQYSTWLLLPQIVVARYYSLTLLLVMTFFFAQPLRPSTALNTIPLSPGVGQVRHLGNYPKAFKSGDPGDNKESFYDRLRMDLGDGPAVSKRTRMLHWADTETAAAKDSTMSHYYQEASYPSSWVAVGDLGSRSDSIATPTPLRLPGKALPRKKSSQSSCHCEEPIVASPANSSAENVISPSQSLLGLLNPPQAGSEVPNSVQAARSSSRNRMLEERQDNLASMMGPDFRQRRSGPNRDPTASPSQSFKHTGTKFTSIANPDSLDLYTAVPQWCFSVNQTGSSNKLTKTHENSPRASFFRKVQARANSTTAVGGIEARQRVSDEVELVHYRFGKDFSEAGPMHEEDRFHAPPSTFNGPMDAASSDVEDNFASSLRSQSHSELAISINAESRVSSRFSCDFDPPDPGGL